MDLGCGNGRHLVHLLKEGFDVIGLDISQTALRMAQEWIEEEKFKTRIVHADMRVSLPFKERSFNAVFSTQVIHHARIAFVRGTIQEISRVLISGGIAFVTVSGQKDGEFEHEEIEPGTFVPITGPEKGLPHHIFSQEELQMEFRDFQVKEISLRAEGKVLAVLVQKP